MTEAEQRSIAEALILASAEPIPAARLARLIPRCTPARVRAMVESLNRDYTAQQRTFEICEVAGGYQIRTHPEYASYLQQLQQTRPLRLSGAALETLAVVAYRQPVTRAEVEHVRGVDAGAVLRSLLERRLVRIAGHREVPGRPLLYGTTRRFLEVFGLASLDDLPTLRDLEELAAAEPEAARATAGEGAGEDPAAAEDEPETGGVPSLQALEIPGKLH